MSPEYVVVSTISHFRLKYAIPLAEFEALGFSEPIDTEKLAEYIQTGAVKEFSQHHLGEHVVEADTYTTQDIIELFDTDNGYLSSWPMAEKIAWINRWKEDIS